MKWAVENGFYGQGTEDQADVLLTRDRFIRAIYRLVSKDETNAAYVSEPVEKDDAWYRQWAVNEGFYEEEQEEDFFEQPVTWEEVFRIMEIVKAQ